MMKKLTPKEKISKARINIQLVQPFFAYIITNAKFIHDEGRSQGTMSVDPRGTIYYSEAFVEKLTMNELQGVIIHEVMHVAFLHLIRKGSRKHNKWNIVTDIIINNMIMNNKIREFRDTKLELELPKCGLIPENNSIFMQDTKQTLDDLQKKSAEELYVELQDPPEGDSGSAGFDNHIYSDDENQDGEGSGPMKKEEVREVERKWKKHLTEAAIYSQQRGAMPSGMNRVLDKILKPKVNWRWLLNKYIMSTLPIDTTWDKPNKKSQAVGVYLPDTVRENIEITVAVDLSGSTVIHYNRFISEMINIAKSFKQVKMNVIFWDTSVFNDLEVANGNIEKILTQKMSNMGGGGTTLSCVSEYLKKNNKNPKLLVVFTDGYIESKPVPLPVRSVIWVMTPKHSDRIVKSLPGQIVSMSHSDKDDED